MPRTKLPCLLPLFHRTITTLTPRFLPFSSSTLPLRLDSYCQPDPRVSVYSTNRVIDSFIKSGQLDAAHKLFDEMPMCDVVTCNLLISGYRKYGFPKLALCFYLEMVSQGMRENPSTFSSVLSICTDARFLTEGMQVHCRVVKLGFCANLFIGSSLVGLYLHMERVDIARFLFDELPERTLPTWNLILRGFCELGQFDDLLGLYYQMRLDGSNTNALSFCYLLRGCSEGKFLDAGKQLHCHVIKLGWVDLSVFVANALVDFYSACGSLVDAKKSFETIPIKDVISWNSIVSVYAVNGLAFEALNLFYVMQIWGKRPSIRSFVGFLKLSSTTWNILLGKNFHCYVLKMGFDVASVHVQSALINMYGKCRDIESSVLVYERVAKRTLECSNSLMTSLLSCGIVGDVLEMFGLMMDEGIGIDEVTLSLTLKAVSKSVLANLDSCRLLHCCALKSGFEADFAVSSSLIDAYFRSGNVEFAEQVFEQLPSPNLICFTSIISGYAHNGLGRECISLFEAMIQMGMKPDKVTFLSVLTGCSHCGLVEEGRWVFDSIKIMFGISPGREHFSCMVDLFGRAGLLDEAAEFLQQAPGRGDCVMWCSLLHSCRVHRNEMVGRRAAKILLEFNPEDFAVYLQVSNFYSEIGEFEVSTQIREIAIARKVTKEFGHSLIEVNDKQ